MLKHKAPKHSGAEKSQPSSFTSKKQWTFPFIITVCAVAALAVISLFMGVYDISGHPDGIKMIWITRIPRTAALMLTGAAMSMSGLVMQLLTQNRLVEPTTTGTIEWAGLGVNHKAGTIYILVLVAVLMSISTALVGPLTFYGFLVATMTYQLAPTYDHKFIFPMSLAVGFMILTSSYFFMYHIFRAQGVVSIIIEMFGGIAFLIVMLRKGTL